MKIKTVSKHPKTIATVEGTFEDAYAVALHFWAIAGNEGVHMDGLGIWDDDDNPVLVIDYTTHER